MKLSEFVERYGALPRDAFLEQFPHPFLLEEGRLSLAAGAPGRQLFLLKSQKPVKIGRARSADLVLPHHQVSSRHALLFPPAETGGSWELMDANSTNGTFLEGEKVPSGNRVPLEAGALLRFGLETRLVFLEAEELLDLLAKRETRRFTARKVNDRRAGSTQRRMPSATATPAPDDAGTAPTPEAFDQPLFLICEPYDPIPIDEGRPLVIGRTAKSADVVLGHEHVSRRHAILERHPDGVYVRDLGSSNGCYVCGVRVGSAPMILLPGKPLEIGPFTLKVEGQGPLDVDPGKTQTVVASQTSTLMGQLELTPLIDLLQAIETEEQTGALEIAGKGGLSGRITFRQGEPYQASTDSGAEGEAAIRELLDLERGTFVLDRDETKVGERRITLGFGEILLDDFLRDG